MKYVIDFFESLQCQRMSIGIIDKVNTYNLEFETKDEQLIVSSSQDFFYFYFSKIPTMMRSNLCREIISVNERQYHLKLVKENTELTLYFNKKFGIITSKKGINVISDKEFVKKLESKLETFDNLKKLLLICKIQDKLPEKNIVSQRAKI